MPQNPPPPHYDIMAVIEQADDGSYSISHERPEGLDVVLAASGSSVAEAKAEFFEMLREYRRDCEAAGSICPTFEVTFRGEC